jgi:hypothetical protein
MGWKKSLTNTYVENIILFCHLCELKKKPLIWALLMCNIIFFSSHMWIKKITCRLTNVQHHFFFPPIWIKKSTHGPTHMQYHFFHPMCESKKPFASSQVCNPLEIFRIKWPWSWLNDYNQNMELIFC